MLKHPTHEQLNQLKLFVMARALAEQSDHQANAFLEAEVVKVERATAKRLTALRAKLGKTWLACALAHQACRQGYSAYYVRLPAARRTEHWACGRPLRQAAQTVGQD